MSIKIEIPKILRQKTGGESSIDVAGGALRECFDTLLRRYPGLKGEILDAQGMLLLRWVILVNGKVIDTSEKLLHPVQDGDVIVLIPMLDGG